MGPERLTAERLADIDQTLCASSGEYGAGIWCQIANELRAALDEATARADEWRSDFERRAELADERGRRVMAAEAQARTLSDALERIDRMIPLNSDGSADCYDGSGNQQIVVTARAALDEYKAWP